MKIYAVFLIFPLLQSAVLFSAQAESKDRNDTLSAALKKVEAAAEKVQEPSAVIAYELPAVYKTAANYCMRIVLGDSAPENALLQDVGEKYDDLRSALQARPQTPRSQEAVERLHKLHETMLLFEYVDGMGKKLANDATLVDRANNIAKKFYPLHASDHPDIEDDYVAVSQDSLSGARVVAESFIAPALLQQSCSIQ